MFAYSYPLLGVFWTMLWFFAFFILIWLLIVVFTDIFRSHDMGGFAKALWCIFIIILPFLGILIYLIARGGSMHERQAKAAQQQEQAFREYVQDAAGSGRTALTSWPSWPHLKDSGAITEAEFQAGKAKILS